MAKRKTAEAQDNTSTDDDIATITEQPPAANPAAAVVHPSPSSQESLPPTGPDGTYQTMREPGDDTQNSWVKKASVLVDPEASVKFHFDYEKHLAIITFDKKPTQELLKVARPILNEGSFEWDKVNKDGWKKKIQFQRREDDRREAKKSFYALANAIRQQKGLPARSFGEVMAL